MPAGGKREGAGRPLGGHNKVTADIKVLAQSFGSNAVMRLAELGGIGVDALGNRLPGAESETTQVAAIKELLDRAYGKAAQAMAGADGEGNPVVEVVYRWATSKDTSEE